MLLQADVNYTKVLLKNDETHTFAKTLKQFEKLLLEQPFFRTHKSYIVNLAFVKNFDEKAKNLHLANNQTIAVSRRNATRIKGILMNLEL